MRLAGKYELIRKLGEGGMAEVWEAVLHGDAGFRRRVAVKRMPAEHLGDERLQRMFVDEANLASRLHHPNLIPVLDFGVDQGVAFQVLELVDGFDVARLMTCGLLAGQPLSRPAALGIVARVAHALHAAHSAVGDDGAPLKVVHRDVNPQNILLSRRGEVKLGDFGIALWERRTEKTVGPVARGKPTSMAPEQAIRGDVDARADIFALGCTLHALLTGQSPLSDENALVDLLAGLELTLDPTLPPMITALIASSVQRDRQRRPQTAEHFAKACEAALAELAPAGFELDRALTDWVRTVAPPPEVAQVSSGSLPPVRRTRWLPLTVVAAVGVLGLLWGTSRSSGGPAAASVVEGVPPPPVPPAEKPALTTAAPPPRPEPVPVPPPVRRAPVVERPSPPRAMGVLAIGGERFLRGEVFVDGASVGLAPRQLELPVGPHQVELVLSDGTRVGPTPLVIEPRHTALSPLTWVD